MKTPLRLATSLISLSLFLRRGARNAKSRQADPYRDWISRWETNWARGQSGPQISFLIMSGPNDTPRLQATLDSLNALQGSNWEAVVRARGEALKSATPIITVPTASSDRGAILSSLFEASAGAFVAVLDAGDVVSPHTLQEVWSCLRHRPDVGVMYSDEDQIAATGRQTPFFKPSWSPEYLESFNYFGRLTVIHRCSAEAVGGFLESFGEAAEYDLHLRLADAPVSIVRIPKVLCHRRPESAAWRDRPAPSSEAAASQRTAVAACWTRRGITADVRSQDDGTVRTVWPLTSPPPVVSIVVLARGELQQLAGCVGAIRRVTRYSRYEIIIVGLRSVPPDMVDLYREVVSAPGCRVAQYTHDFKYASLCNAGAAVAEGQLLVFLDERIEVMEADWLEDLVRCVNRPGVAIGGPMLVSPHGRLEQGGIIVGMGDGCGTVFRGGALDAWGVFGSPSVARNYLAVASGCQIVTRTAFDQIGGFDETYRGADAGIAFGLAAWRAGFRTVYTPQVRLIDRRDVAREHRDTEDDRPRLSRDLVTFAVLDDPYFHPSLSGEASIPTLLGDPDTSTTRILRDLRDKHLPDGRRSNIDLFDTTDVLETLGSEHAAQAFWMPEPPQATSGPYAAARFIIDLLRRSKDIRDQFPAALSEGPEGAFAKWLMDGEGRRQFGLTPPQIKNIDACFHLNLSGLVRVALLSTREPQQELTFGSTPLGLRQTLNWLFVTGRTEHALPPEAIWWFACQCHEQPEAEIVRTFLFNPIWQRLFPDGLTVFARRELSAWIKALNHLDSDWLDSDKWPIALSASHQLRLAYFRQNFWQQMHPEALTSLPAAEAFLQWLRSEESGTVELARDWIASLDVRQVTEDLVRPGVNVLGHFCYPSGLRTSAESIVLSLRQADVDVAVRDVWVGFGMDDPGHETFDGLEVHPVTLIHVQPDPFFDEVYARSGLFERHPRTHRIGYWYWELDEVPASWVAQVAQVDEIWAATSFVGDALRRRFDKPVFDLLPGIELSRFDRVPRFYFGLDENRYTFLFVFHMTSVMERKNPIGLIRAFRKAFGFRPEASLVIKTSFGADHPEHMSAMRDAAAGDGISIIDAVHSPQETLSLIDACDCYVSLHRSEGYGLTMAEAMLLGKPVIATGYSGNLDFMDSTNSILVKHDLVTLQEEYPPYERGQRWAEPSVDHAAACMRSVFENRDWATNLGQVAKADLSERLSYATAGAKMKRRLLDIKSL